ncbi:hypothetical protein POM88_027857 [Heracleum sosnowskyi]|uniref:Single-stranded DNA binding protein Ssb-like OB fold domain-containing protein n=1 Tax=Heracleum sosnowskyi TaxID=360622 RepID=A0AAD8I9B9_9APIA|nr:hypothetical protein POM88_027857 [Heracleum sosnowskyi]
METKPGSYDFFFHVSFQTESSGFLGLFARSNNFPVCISSGEGKGGDKEKILVLNPDLWNFVDPQYKKGKNIETYGFDFGFYEKEGYCFEVLQSAVDVIACMDVTNDVTLRSAVSRMIVVFSMSCFCKESLEFVQQLIDNRDWFGVLEDSLLIRSRTGGRFLGEEIRVVVGRDRWPGRKVELLVFLTVCNLNANLKGKFHMLVKVVSNERVPVLRKNLKVHHCVIGDSSGLVVFKAVDEQVELFTTGITVMLLGANVQIFQGKIYVVVDKNGSIVDDCAVEDDFEVNMDVPNKTG